MVHRIKKETDPVMKSYDEEFKKMGISTEEESQEDWLERQKKEYERDAKQLEDMYLKAVEVGRKVQKFGRETKRALQKGREFVQERVLHREPTRRPIKVFLSPKKREEEIEYGEW